MRMLLGLAATLLCRTSLGEPYEQRTYLNVVSPRVAVEVEDAELSFDVGSRARFFQETGGHFIGLTETQDGQKRLFAVPNRNNGGKTAWVTPEKLMFFGFRTRTCKGRLILIAPEKLPVLEITQADYLAQVERYGEKAQLRIPKRVQGLELVSELIESAPAVSEPALESHPKAAVLLSPAARREPSRDSSERPQLRALMEGNEAEASTATQSTTVVETEPALNTLDVLEDVIEEPPPAAEEQAIVTAEVEGPEEWQIEDPAALEVSEPQREVARDVPVTELDTGFSWMAVVAVAEFFLLILLGLLVFRRRAHAHVLRHQAEQQPEPETAVSDPVSTMRSKGYQDEVSLCGSLESMPLLSVVEILLAKHEDGLLSVSLPGQEVVGSMTIRDGEVIDACHGDQRGEDAFLALLALKTGLFMFVHSDTGEYERTIDEPTVALLMKGEDPNR